MERSILSDGSLFQDDEGFMVTKMEMESCSDDSQPETAVPVVQKEQVKAEPKSPAKKSSGDSGAKKSGDSGAKKSATATSNSTGKPKQPSIMNFFQKK